MGYKRMKKRGERKLGLIREIIQSIELLDKRDFVWVDLPNMQWRYDGKKLNRIDDAERMKWFESPNAEGYLDM